VPPVETLTPLRGMTTADVARYLRISEDRVRTMIQSGELGAISTAPTRCGRPRYVVLPHHLAEFEQAHRVVVPTKTGRRPRRAPTRKRYFTDVPDVAEALR
jgi:excisionase family DNA binding protein